MSSSFRTNRKTKKVYPIPPKLDKSKELSEHRRRKVIKEATEKLVKIVGKEKAEEIMAEHGKKVLAMAERSPDKSVFRLDLSPEELEDLRQKNILRRKMLQYLEGEALRKIDAGVSEDYERSENHREGEE